MLRTVNYANLTVLSAFHFLTPRETREVLEAYDPNSEQDVKAMLRRYIVPLLGRIEVNSPGTYDRLKDSLRYFLNTGGFPIEDVYEAEEPIIGLPSDAMNYYRWAWDVLWPAEPWKLNSLAGYVEQNGRP